MASLRLAIAIKIQGVLTYIVRWYCENRRKYLKLCININFLKLADTQLQEVLGVFECNLQYVQSMVVCDTVLL